MQQLMKALLQTKTTSVVNINFSSIIFICLKKITWSKLTDVKVDCDSATKNYKLTHVMAIYWPLQTMPSSLWLLYVGRTNSVH